MAYPSSQSAPAAKPVDSVTPTASSAKPKMPLEEQKKIKEIWEQEEKQRREFLAKIQGKKGVPVPQISTIQANEQEIIRPLPARPAFYEKIWVRIASAILIIAAIGGVSFFGYWLLTRGPTPNPSPPPIPVECKINSDCSQDKTCQNNHCVKVDIAPQVNIPPSLIFEDSVKTITFSSSEDLVNQLKLIVNESAEAKKIARIVAIDGKISQAADIKSVMDNLRSNPPPNIYDKLESNATLFAYSSGSDNRLGFVVKIKNKQGLDAALKLWEKTMSSDLKPFFGAMKDQQTPANSYFQDTKYRNSTLRFQPFFEENLGIYYAIFNDFFILTSSRQSMEKIMDNITKTATPAPPIISQKLLSFGRLVVKSRSITLVVMHSAYNMFENDPYDIDGMIREYRKLGAAPHYAIAKDGTIYQLVEDKNIAYHTTGYITGTKTYINNVSIGIEMIYKDNESPTKFQYQSAAQLVKYLQWKYNISQSNISSHSELVPGKDDPWNFSWPEFRSYLDQE
jgi:hypothetical protein